MRRENDKANNTRSVEYPLLGLLAIIQPHARITCSSAGFARTVEAGRMARASRDDPKEALKRALAHVYQRGRTTK